MARVHLWEWEDLPWVPDFIRRFITDHLRFLAQVMGLFQPLMPQLVEALRASGARRIVDLCSGAGGPVPGLFAGAVTGTQAFIAYQNSLGGVYGRKLELDVRDDQFDTGQNRAQTSDLIGKAFALIGSFSLYDDAGLPAIEQSGIPNIQVPLTQALQESPANFSINPVRRGTPLGPWNFLKSKFPNAVTAVGGLYGDVPAAKDSFLNNKAAAESVGYKFIYERGYAPTETDFTADVVRMRQAGVKFFFTNSRMDPQP